MKFVAETFQYEPDSSRPQAPSLYTSIRRQERRRRPENLACNKSGEVTGPQLLYGNVNCAGRDTERLDGFILLVKAM